MANAAAPATAFDREFLNIRHRLIDIAAALDRVDRAADSQPDDPRRKQILRSLEILASDAKNRAEQIQMEFSKRG